MITIGIIGGNETADIKNILHLIYENVGLDLQLADHTSIMCNSINHYSRRSDALIVSIDAHNFNFIISNEIKFSILIVTDSSNLTYVTSLNYLMPLSSNNIVIVNADDKNIFRYTRGIHAKLITFGYNNKASITPSSITDDFGQKTVHCCVQRTFKTITGNKLYPHEFPMSFGMAEADVYSQLAAAATALVNDVSLY